MIVRIQRDHGLQVKTARSRWAAGSASPEASQAGSHLGPGLRAFLGKPQSQLVNVHFLKMRRVRPHYRLYGSGSYRAIRYRLRNGEQRVS